MMDSIALQGTVSFERLAYGPLAVCLSQPEAQRDRRWFAASRTTTAALHWTATDSAALLLVKPQLEDALRVAWKLILRVTKSW